MGKTISVLKSNFYDKKGRIRKSLLRHRCCDVCGCDDYSFLFEKEKFTFVKCVSCGFVFVNPTLSSATLERYYSEVDDDYWEDQTSFVLRRVLSKKYNDELKLIERHAKVRKKTNKGKVLDIGCGGGIFMYHAQKRGWEVYGTEFNKISRNFIKRELKISTVYDGNLKRFRAGLFDLVTLHQVFEHLPEPNAIIEEVRRILHPGGLLLISVPNIYGLTTRVMKEHSGHFQGSGHLNYFSRANLQQILDKHGFNTVAFKTEGFKWKMLLSHFHKPKLASQSSSSQKKSYWKGRGEVSGFQIRIYYAICFLLNLFSLCDYNTILARKRK